MQKFLFTIAIAFTALIMNAQSPEEAAKQLDKRKLDKAKEIIDKLTTDPNSKDAYAWLVKAQVYNAIAADEAMKVSVPDAYEQAFEAYKKAYDINPNLIQLKLDGYLSPGRSYDGIAGKAAMAFQNSNYAVALDMYKKMLAYGTYLNAKNLTNNGYPPKFDTLVIFYSGYVAMKLDKEDEAITYFSKLANAKIGKEADYIIPYQYLAYSYKEKGDSLNFKKYVTLGKDLYPASPYFPSLVIDWDRENIEKASKAKTGINWATENNYYQELFESYETLIKLQPDSVKHHLIYANDIFDYLFTKNQDKKIGTVPNSAALIAKADEELQASLRGRYDTLNTLILMSGLYYNQGYEAVGDIDRLKSSTKPDDVKKRKDMIARTVSFYEKSIPFTEMGVKYLEGKGTSKISEKQLLKSFYGYLGDMWRMKGEKAKLDGDAANAKAYTAKADDYDKKWEAVNLK